MASYKNIFFIDVEHDYLSHRAVQNKQVCGIVCNYKQIYSEYEGFHALFPYNIKNTRIIIREMRPLPLKFLNYIFWNANNRVFYCKYTFDPGIQVWLGDVEEALTTRIDS